MKVKHCITNCTSELRLHRTLNDCSSETDGGMLIERSMQNAIVQYGLEVLAGE